MRVIANENIPLLVMKFFRETISMRQRQTRQLRVVEFVQYFDNRKLEIL